MDFLLVSLHTERSVLNVRNGVSMAEPGQWLPRVVVNLGQGAEVPLATTLPRWPLVDAWRAWGWFWTSRHA